MIIIKVFVCTSLNVILKPSHGLTCTLNSGKALKRVYHHQLLHGGILCNADDNVVIVLKKPVNNPDCIFIEEISHAERIYEHFTELKMLVDSNL